MIIQGDDEDKKQIHSIYEHHHLRYIIIIYMQGLLRSFWHQIKCNLKTVSIWQKYEGKLERTMWSKMIYKFSLTPNNIYNSNSQWYTLLNCHDVDTNEQIFFFLQIHLWLLLLNNIYEFSFLKLKLVHYEIFRAL